MFMNRHLNYGYLLVIVVAFVIAMSASCKLAYAGEVKEEILRSKPDEAFMIITIKVKKDGGINVISVAAGGVDQNGKPAKVVDGPRDQNLGDLEDVIGGSNPCKWINVGGRTKKVCW